MVFDNLKDAVRFQEIGNYFAPTAQIVQPMQDAVGGKDDVEFAGWGI